MGKGKGWRKEKTRFILLFNKLPWFQFGNLNKWWCNHHFSWKKWGGRRDFHKSCGLDVYSQCQRTCFGSPSSKGKVWTHTCWSGPRAFGCRIQDRVALASSFVQLGKTNKNLGFCLVWELPALPPGECRSQQALESNEILSTGEEPPWHALRARDCNTWQACARINSNNSLGWGQQRVWTAVLPGSPEPPLPHFLFSRFACEKTCF